MEAKAAGNANEAGGLCVPRSGGRRRGAGAPGGARPRSQAAGGRAESGGGDERPACATPGGGAPHVAHSQIRNRGTLGGSLAHAAPAAELPAVMVAPEARIRLRSREAERWLS